MPVKKNGGPGRKPEGETSSASSAPKEKGPPFKPITKPNPPKKDKRPCTPPDLCAYVEELDNWLWNDFWPDYLKVRNAVCNLDRFARIGVWTPAAALCPGTGGGTEPPAATPPPKW